MNHTADNAGVGEGRPAGYERLLTGRSLLAWLVMVLVFSVIPIPDTGIDTGSFPADKAVHFVVYGVTSIMLFRFFYRRAGEKKSAVLLAIASASLYGLLLEALQYLMPHRSFSLADAAINALGAIVFVLVYKIIAVHNNISNG